MTRPVPAAEQIAATRPDQSNWVGANAGSGKTHVLTQRVARLLLAGAAPQKILCLTYTKAAAAEMQNRLFRLLGDWAMAPEAELSARLAELSGGTEPLKDPEILAEARRLFARALETPGGLKIQTIHAFCDSLLRRFPLEAGVSPRFEVADDRQSKLMQADIRAEMANAAEAGQDDAFDRAARLLNEGGIDQLSSRILARRAPFRTDNVNGTLTAHFGEVAQQDRIEIAKQALGPLDWETLDALRAVLLDKGKSSDRPVGEVLSDGADGADDDPDRFVHRLIAKVLTQKGQARSTRGFPSVEVKKLRPSSEDELARLTDWALETRQSLLASDMAARTRDLYAFAGAFLNRQDHGKGARGLLDFDDLVSRAHGLLTDQHMRAWVLYKLDQGIDHILVDEAQDTSPQQWEVISAIAEEFLSGQGARPEARSLFVVGDEKQSIYSFQGAEPQAFGGMRQHFAERLEALGAPLGRPDLITSYRSAPAILEFVDRVFSGDAADGLTVGADKVRHVAHRQDARGRVDLWPLIEKEEAPEPSPWWEPVDAPSSTDPKQRLATHVAEQINAMIGHETLPARAERPARLVAPGDILVLVRRRDRLAQGIIRGLKQRGVPVAGADRLSLLEEIAVKDLLALARVATMREDDLSLAALLRSPLCGLSEDDLFGLAHARKSTLWQALQTSDAHPEAAALLHDMARQADFLRPYEFLERVLIHHDGRRRLLARLGAEAEDPIDELLNQALAYEARETPSLTGFVAWLEMGDITVKREMDRGTGEVRVMTVHGAKGLEAPVVILPDTFPGGRPGGGPLLLPAETGGNAPPLTLWAGARDQDDNVTAEARAAADAREAAEQKRLLYVALTRAEDWLILCGAMPGNRKSADGTWYGLVQDAMDACQEGGLPVALHPSPTGEGDMRRLETGLPVEDIPEQVAPGANQAPLRPDWLTKAATETRRERGRPSDLGADEETSGGAGLGREIALRRGVSVHALLERLGHDAEELSEMGPRLLDNGFRDLTPEIRAGALAEALAVLKLPKAAALFGPDALAEVSVTIDPPNKGLRMIGRIDRLVLSDTHALVVDIKTDSRPPAMPDQVPGKYLAQLGAYASAVREGWPEREVSVAILWTATPALMQIPADLADRAFHATSFSRNTGS